MTYHSVLVLLVMLVTVLTGCRSVRQSVDTDFAMNGTQREEMNLIMERGMVDETGRLREWLGSEELKVDFVVFRAPDSTGRVSVAAKGTALRNRSDSAREVEQRVVADSANAVVDHKAQRQSGQSLVQRTQEETVRHSGLKMAVALTLLVILLIIVYKKNKVWLHY